mmetsp:Transcript_96538/g.300642  ORF Transcript_96538/g.300642 Transcript_96538/m.300642 type:complete len:305 (+) Transcript_96538:1175-2089(+)
MYEGEHARGHRRLEKCLVQVHHKAESGCVEDQVFDGRRGRQPADARVEQHESDAGADQVREEDERQPARLQRGEGAALQPRSVAARHGEDRPRGGRHAPQLPQHDDGEQEDADAAEQDAASHALTLEVMRFKAEVVVDLGEQVGLVDGQREGFVPLADAARQAHPPRVDLVVVVRAGKPPLPQRLHQLLEPALPGEAVLHQQHLADVPLHEDVQSQGYDQSDRAARPQFRQAHESDALPECQAEAVLQLNYVSFRDQPLRLLLLGLGGGIGRHLLHLPAQVILGLVRLVPEAALHPLGHLRARR